ncbi:MAG: hypothetical protein ACYCOR_14120 [Acidobacteriaceae bacterium]
MDRRPAGDQEESETAGPTAEEQRGGGGGNPGATGCGATQTCVGPATGQLRIDELVSSAIAEVVAFFNGTK